jgi:hypothetical protein
MITQNLKFVSYLGGSAGDLFTVSANGSIIDPTKISVQNNSSIKMYEKDIEQDILCLDRILPSITTEYVSTHLFLPLVNAGHFVINIVIDDSAVQNTIILRQMQLQKLRIQVQPNEVFFKIIKSYCLDGKFKKAAEVWLFKAKSIWLEQMQQRLESTQSSVLNFNQLFSSTFANSIEKQGWDRNAELLYQNHQYWLEKNQNFSISTTLNCMEQKLKSMDWAQATGSIISKI